MEPRPARVQMGKRVGKYELGSLWCACLFSWVGRSGRHACSSPSNGVRTRALLTLARQASSAGRTLGEGSFGKVKFARNVETGEQVAIKILEKDTIIKQGMTQQINKEISIMKLIKHENIVNLYDVLASSSKIYIVLELVTGGELFYKLATEGRFMEDTARRYFQQLIMGLRYCHSKGICHRDLKPENILLSHDDVLKISDFGLSALQEEADGHLLRTTCGTPNYVAPEVFSPEGGYNGAKADIWSCGVILYVFLAGFLPFEESSTQELFRKIQIASFRFPPWFTDGAKHVIDRMLQPDPAVRMTIDELLADAWFRVDLDRNCPQEVAGAGSTAGAAAALSPSVAESVDIGADGLLVGEDDAGDDDQIPGREEAVSKITNAFELIGKSGVFDLTRMLERHPPDQIKRYTRFSTKCAPETIIELLQSVLDQMPVGYKLNPRNYSIIVNAASSKGMIVFVIQLYELSGGVLLVDLVKQRGDTLEFAKYYRQIYERCADASLPADADSSSAAGAAGSAGAAGATARRA